MRRRFCSAVSSTQHGALQTRAVTISDETQYGVFFLINCNFFPKAVKENLLEIIIRTKNIKVRFYHLLPFSINLWQRNFSADAAKDVN